MAYSQVLDITQQINDAFAGSGYYVVDMGDFASCTAQVVGSNAIDIYTSNDGGAIQGVIENNASTAINFTTCSGIDLSNSSTTGLVAQVSHFALVKFENTGQYLQFVPSGVVDKCIIRLYQVY